MPEPLSGAVRFSVDTLLYYAPKIVNTGDELTTAVDKAQRTLTNLGDFFGGSWPDEPFRDSYPRAQWAMIIIARQIAEQIQGIGAGIEDMGRTYQAAEDEITEAARRILPDQARTDARVARHGGYARPPVIPDSRGHASTAVNPFAPHPSPTPGAPAVPPGATIGRTSAAVPTPIRDVLTSRPQSPGASPVIEPRPQPGIDPTTWHPLDQWSFLGPWPSGDPNRMEDAADTWKALTASLDDAWAELKRYTAYIMADCEGKAANLFEDYADALTGRGYGLLFRAIDMAQQLRNACENQAAAIRQIKKELEEALLEIGATFVIGQVLSLLTFGEAETATAAIEVTVANRLTAMVTKFVELGATVERTMDVAAEGIGKIAAATTVGGAQTALIGAGDLAATNAIGRAFGDKPVVGAAALKAVAIDGAIGTVLGQGTAGGLLGLSAAAASERLISLGEALEQCEGYNASTAGTALRALGEELKDGSMTVSAANAAASQYITQHAITPLTFITSAVSNRFTTAIGPHTGRHAKL